jgi:hypothetical protein
VATHYFKCQICASPFEATRSDAVQCSPACRQAAFRARQDAVNAHNRLAADLLRRQTRAIIDGGDPVVLAAIAREADELFVEAV